MIPTRREFDVPLPDRMKLLPIDRRGFPVPKFVEWIDGEPDFRVISPTHYSNCVRFKKCWICGQGLGRYWAFVVGPMCCVNQVNSEPPCHYECARFAAVACPFLSKPLAKRPGVDDLEDKLGKKVGVIGGTGLQRNPGVTAIWVTRSYRQFKAGNGVLIEMGEPERLEFYRQGRPATRAEIDHSVATGLPLLEEPARAEGPAAMREFKKYCDRFEQRMQTYWKEPEEITQ